VLSAAAGAFALELLFTLLTTYEVAATWRDTVQGLIIILAVAAAGRAWQVGRRPRGSRRTPLGTSSTSSSSTPDPGTTSREIN
jgi:ribose transport system permease protein